MLQQLLHYLNLHFVHVVQHQELYYLVIDASLPIDWLLFQPLFAKEIERLLQRFVLSIFYYATDGDNWDVNTGWLTAVPECTWYGVELCENDSIVDFYFGKFQDLIPFEILHF